QNSNVRATRPTLRYSSTRPSSARISSVGGCVVEARGASSMRSCASSSVTVWPKRAAASAATLPTGPAPTTRMFRRCMDRGDYTEPVIEPCRLGAKEAAARIERGELSARSLIESCFERIAAREPDVQAWAFANKEVVLSQLNHIEKTGRLRGVPVGVKDIFDTYDMPTEYGSRIYAGHRPRADSAPVAMTRAAGGVILGKTVTCEFATFVPSKTRNPRNAAHTPGGSSSGSAAAIADFMVPLAFGTQTAGSVIRPGSYCGVVACKPTLHPPPRAGVHPNADSLDTVGVYARSVEDVAFFLEALTRRDDLQGSIDRPRIGSCRTWEWELVEPPMVAAFEAAAKKLDAAELRLPES